MSEPGREPLFTRPFVVLWIFYFLVFVAGYQLFPLVPFRLRELGASLSVSGRFMALFTLGSGIGGFVTGPLGDRLGQRRVLSGAALLSGLFLMSYAVLPTVGAFLVLAPVHGFVWSGLRTASVARISSVLPDAHRAEGLSLFGLASPGGVAVGPLLGLWLQPHLGFGWLVALLGAVFLGLHRMIRLLPRDPAPAGPAFVRPPWPDRWVWVPAGTLFLLALSYGPMAPYSAQEARAAGQAWPAAFLTCFALGMLGLRLVLGVVGLGPRPARLIPWMAALTTLGCALLAGLPGGTSRHIAAGLVYGAGYGIVHTLLFLVVMEGSAPQRRGAGAGALYGMFDAGVATGAFSLGLVMERWGFRAGWGVATAMLALATLTTAWVARRWR